MKRSENNVSDSTVRSASGSSPPAKLIKSDGTVTDVYPNDGKRFTLDEKQEFVGGLIAYMRCIDPTTTMVVNESGIPRRLPPNHLASAVAQPQVTIQNGREFLVLLAGDVLVGPTSLVINNGRPPAKAQANQAISILNLIPPGVPAADAWEASGRKWYPDLNLTLYTAAEHAMVADLAKRYGPYIVTYSLMESFPKVYCVEWQFAPEHRQQMRDCLRSGRRCRSRVGRTTRTAATATTATTRTTARSRASASRCRPRRDWLSCSWATWTAVPE